MLSARQADVSIVKDHSSCHAWSPCTTDYHQIYSRALSTVCLCRLVAFIICQAE